MEERNEIFDVKRIAEVELIYKNPVKPALRPLIGDAKSAFEIFLSSWDLAKIELQEHFKILLLNRGCKVLGIFTLSEGGLNETVVDRKLLFATAIKSNACRVILAHNHPSGQTNPSSADIEITKKIVEGGKILDIRVEDHLIICRDSYYSFADNGLM